MRIARFKEIPDNDAFKKQLIRDILLCVVVGFISVIGVVMTLYYSLTGDW
jgi:hypothetical protein